MSNKNLPPQEIKYSKLKHLETKYYRSETGILFCMWRPVIIVLTSATKGDTEMQNKPSKITKLNVINDYNNAMVVIGMIKLYHTIIVFIKKQLSGGKNVCMVFQD